MTERDGVVGTLRQLAGCVLLIRGPSQELKTHGWWHLWREKEPYTIKRPVKNLEEFLHFRNLLIQPVKCILRTFSKFCFYQTSYSLLLPFSRILQLSWL